MKLNEAYEILEIHQKWRKGEEGVKQTRPALLTIAIDLILKAHNAAEMTISIPKESSGES